VRKHEHRPSVACLAFPSMSYNAALSSIVFANSRFSSAFFEAGDERECDWARNRAGAVVAALFPHCGFL